jgi:hypothetical protein
MPNPKANAPAAPNSLQRVVSFRMIYSFIDQEAPGQQTARPFERCSASANSWGQVQESRDLQRLLQYPAHEIFRYVSARS